jgi:hypothetical protein
MILTMAMSLNAPMDSLVSQLVSEGPALDMVV